MDDHSVSWASVALIFTAGYGIGAASALLLLGIWRALRRLAGEE